MLGTAAISSAVRPLAGSSEPPGKTASAPAGETPASLSSTAAAAAGRNFTARPIPEDTANTHNIHGATTEFDIAHAHSNGGVTTECSQGEPRPRKKPLPSKGLLARQTPTPLLAHLSSRTRMILKKKYQDTRMYATTPLSHDMITLRTSTNRNDQSMHTSRTSTIQGLSSQFAQARSRNSARTCTPACIRT